MHLPCVDGAAVAALEDEGALASMRNRHLCKVSYQLLVPSLNRLLLQREHALELIRHKMSQKLLLFYCLNIYIFFRTNNSLPTYSFYHRLNILILIEGYT